MARSNNQDRTAPPTGRQPRPAPPVEHGLPWSQGSQPADPRGGAPLGAAPGQLPWPQGVPPPPQAYAQQGYPPQQPQGYAAQGYPPQAGYPVDPQFDPYLPQSAPHPGYTDQPAYPGQAPQLRGTYAAHPEAGYGPGPGQPGYLPPTSYDPRTQGPQGGYDLGAYATPPVAGYPTTRTQPPTAVPQGYAPPHGQFQPGQPGFGAPVAGAEPEYDDEYDDDDEAYEEDGDDVPRSRFSFLRIVAALAIAGIVGGGAAVGYKMFLSKPSNDRAPIILKADTSPAKSRPVSAAQSDASAPADGDRLGGSVPPVVPSGGAATGDNTPAGARLVQTINIAPPTPSATPNEPPMRPTLTMPGLAVEGLPSAPPRGGAQPPLQPSAVARAAPQPAPPIAPRVVAAAETPPAPAVAPPRIVPKKAVVSKAPKVDDAFNPSGAGSNVGTNSGAAVVATATTTAPAALGAPPAAGRNGYVAVLFSSQGNAIDARKALDGMQAKYADVLGGKPTDVTEATVKGKLWYRGIVGPPGSREAATAMCNQLKGAGLSDCFTAAY